MTKQIKGTATNTGAPAEQTTAQDVEQKQIPTPPAGGRWRWDDAAGEWINLNPPAEPAEQPSQSKE